MSATKQQPEPWLRGTYNDVSSVQRAVLHALVLAREDLEIWCSGLTDAELNARPFDLTPISFHFRHIARSMDRLLTYAEGGQLNDAQIAAMNAEMDPGATYKGLFAELTAALDESARRIRSINPATLEEPRTVGARQLPTTVGGLLVHVADHTQRHVGQAITTSKVLRAHP